MLIKCTTDRISRLNNVQFLVYICGVTRITRRFGWSLPEVLRPFSGHFVLMHFGRTASEAHHLIFGHYVIRGCCDVICDIMAPHVHWSCDLLLYKVCRCPALGSWPLVHPFVRFAFITCVWLVSNVCRSQCVLHISRLEPTSFKHNYCISLG